MSTTAGFDVIIVGGGATGSWAARLLTESGLRVLVLDSGSLAEIPRQPKVAAAAGRAPVADRPALEQPASRQETQSQCYAFNVETRHLFVDDIDQPYDTPGDRPFSWIRTGVVGGRTVLWHRVALRMSDRQFGAASLDGFQADWPMDYDDLRPYYDAAERFLGVTGIAANLDEVPDGVFLPMELPEPVQLVQEIVQGRWPERRVTALRQARATPATPVHPHESRGRRQGAPYPTCSAGDALSLADGTGRMTLRHHCKVIGIVPSHDGKRAEGVSYVDCLTGESGEARGQIVLMCASTIETTRILLSSTSRLHPDGMGNSTGLVGKFLMEHTSGVGVTGSRSGRYDNTAEFYIPNFRNRNGARARFLRGYGVQGKIMPGAGETHQCELISFGEVLPRAQNRVTLGSRKDRWGIAVPHITYSYSDNELEMVADQEKEVQEIMSCIGFDVTCRHALRTPGLSMHELGTVRMGQDPRTSVLNGYGQCWSVRNLFVTDGSVFPSGGFQNPTLTMMAVTGRTCAHIAQEFNRERRRPFA